MTEEKKKQISHLISTWHEKDNPARLRYEKLEDKYNEIDQYVLIIEKSIQITEKDLNIIINMS